MSMTEKLHLRESWRMPPAVALALFFLACLQPATASEEETGMLWRVSGHSNSVYLLGSVHMLRESDFPLPGDIESAYTDAEALVMELDMDDLNPLAVQTLFFTRGTLPDDTTLAEVMGETRWREASAAASALGIDLSMLKRVKPWWAAITVVQLQLGKIGFNPELGLEGYFTQRAGADGKPIEGLETAAFQIGLFDSMDEERQVEMLMKALDDAQALEQEMDKLLRAWRSGDTNTLATIQSESFADFPALYDALIHRRNRDWITALSRLLDDERDYLVVVGALHLVGKDGVPAGLADMGYKVVRE
ncbi:MAG: TraB/GumN family protein [Gammaproteobacteria bacterium]|nr:TraB/GumN family protein [Gammaproteobacteria bacterium]